MTDRTSLPAAAESTRTGWRVVDIVVASVIAVAVGVLFFVWSSSWSVISVPFAAFEPLQGLLTGVWCLAGPLGALIIRKPGAALYCEFIAAMVSAFLGTQWGMQVLISGLIQGLGAEAVFLALRYRRWTFGSAALAGLGAGLALGLGEVVMYHNQWALTWQGLYIAFTMVSGLVLAGIGAWILMRAIAATGALSSFAAGRSAKEV